MDNIIISLLSKFLEQNLKKRFNNNVSKGEFF